MLPSPAQARLPALRPPGAAAVEIKPETRPFNFRYRSPKHFLDVFETYYGPINRVFATLDQQRQVELRDDLHALILRMNRANNGAMVVPSEYLEVVIER